MVIVAIWLVLAGAPSGSQAKPCSQADSEAADRALDQLNSWAAVQHVFHAFGHCDDGAIAEGYSDRIMQLFSKRWNTVVDLDRRVRADLPFRAFVLRHIDETWVNTELARVMANAAAKCPPSARPTCRAIMKRGKEIDEAVQTRPE